MMNKDDIVTEVDAVGSYVKVLLLAVSRPTQPDYDAVATVLFELEKRLQNLSIEVSE